MMVSIKKSHLISLISALTLGFAVFLNSSSAFSAACTPGIPCTGYDVNTDTTAGTDAGLNGPKTGLAAPYTGGMCDGNFMNQILAKAYMEASREVIINEQLIHKPDSVLEYTCFDQFIAQTAHNAGPIFSETDDFDSREVDLCTGDDSCGTNTTTYTVNYDDDHLDNVLDILLLDTLEDYITNNFSHTYLGGESSVNNNLDYTGIRGNSYDCDQMQIVWDIAKCRDFGEDDQFFNFETLSTEDPRILITECSPGKSMASGSGTNSPMPITENPRCPAAGGGPFANTNITNDIIRVANNCDFLFVVYDTMVLYFELLKAPGSTIGGTTYVCSDPIPTGLQVFTRAHTYFDWSMADNINPPRITPADSTHDDKFCPNPGCWYDFTSDTCQPPPP
ncbi:MAG: hypothetical protein KDI61_06700 [Alphaproteobacteria bacterium]|nr:hypothetical protein [Alphaproteobacteria bacterium]